MLDPKNQLVTWKEKVLAFFLLGMISTTYAELWLGFVFITRNQVLLLGMMILFYGAQVLFYYNLAIYFRRTSFIALYWWGTLFGLYEAWVTTMVYFGYGNVIGHHGEILGIAVYEYFANVFFWHPMNSFILTLMSMQILFPVEDDTIGEVKLAQTFIQKTKRNKWFWGLYFVYASAMITSCTYGSELNVIIYYMIFYVLTLFVYFVLRHSLQERHVSPFVVLRLGKRGLWILGLMLGVYYLFNFIVLIWGKPIYNPFAFVIIFLTYVWSLFMIKKVKAEQLDTERQEAKEMREKRFSPAFILIGLVLPFFGTMLLRVSLLLAWVLSVTAVELTMVFGIVLLGVMSYNVFFMEK